MKFMWIKSSVCQVTSKIHGVLVLNDDTVIKLCNFLVSMMLVEYVCVHAENEPVIKGVYYQLVVPLHHLQNYLLDFFLNLFSLSVL